MKKTLFSLLQTLANCLTSTKSKTTLIILISKGKPSFLSSEYERRISFVLIFVGLLVLNGNVLAQTDKLNRIIPPSPQLSQFNKYGDYPVDHSTGIPAIDIPLYEIKTTKLSLPISLSYHASGFKVDDQNGILGLGWSLQAGGRISRTLQGSPDEKIAYPIPYKTESQIDISNYDDLTYLKYAAANEKSQTAFDTEYDVFNFSMNGDNGKFVLARGTGGNRVPTTFPFRPVKITSNTPGFNSDISFFEIVDEQGNTYRFGQSKDLSQANLEIAKVSSGSRQYTSGWFLSEIISYDKTESIKLLYADISQIRTRRTDICTVEDNYSGEECKIPGPTLCLSPIPNTPDNYQITTESINNTSTVYDTKVLKEIQFTGGKAVFNYSTDVAKKLLSIDIMNVSSELLRKISFTQATYTNHTFYNKLTTLKFQDKNSIDIQKYVFDYNETASFPGNGSGGDLKHTSAVDYWGFYNGKSSTGSIVPRADLELAIKNGGSMTYRNETVSFGDRDADEEPMKTFVIKKITYPTGGTSEFEFGANRSLNKIIGGLRIKRIISTDAISGQVIKRFEYGLGENQQGELLLNPYSVNSYLQTYLAFNFPPLNNNYCDVPPAGLPCYTMRIRTISSDFIDGSSLFESNPVFYTDVTEYQDAVSGVLGKTTYKYELPVTGYGSIGYSQIVRSYGDWMGRHLLNKSVYKNASTGFTLIKKEDYLYAIELGDPLNSLRSVCRYYGLANKTLGTLSQLNQFYAPAFEYFDYRFENGRKILTKKTETEVTESGNVVTDQVMTYTSAHNNPVLKSTSNSRSGTINETFKYPSDAAYGSGSYQEDARLKLISLNNLEALLEQKISNGTTQVELTKNFYKDFSASGIPFKESIETDNRSTTESRIQFEGYKNGKLIQQSLVNGPKTSYKWGYKELYPIAEIRNSAVNEFYLQNFEEPELGLDFEANVVNDNAQVHTGKYSGRIINPNATEFVSHSDKGITISLTAPKKFTYSGWVYSNGPSAQLHLFMFKAGETAYFSYVDAVQTTVINKWVYVKKDFLVPADVVYMKLRIDNNAAGTVWFDDLRIQPTDASMSTYTYEPLVGMTSAIDDSGKTVYYEYDTFQRLVNIKDQNGFIIKNYDYHYKP